VVRTDGSVVWMPLYSDPNQESQDTYVRAWGGIQGVGPGIFIPSNAIFMHGDPSDNVEPWPCRMGMGSGDPKVLFGVR